MEVSLEFTEFTAVARAVGGFGHRCSSASVAVLRHMCSVLCELESHLSGWQPPGGAAVRGGKSKGAPGARKVLSERPSPSLCRVPFPL